MKKPLILLASSAILLLATTLPVPPAKDEAPAIDITTSIRPVNADPYQLLGKRQKPPGLYRCTVTVNDRESGRTITTRDIVIGAGQSGESGSDAGPLQVKFTARISEDLHRAETTTIVRRDGTVINRQKSSVWLEPQTGSIQPAQ